VRLTRDSSNFILKETNQISSATSADVKATATGASIIAIDEETRKKMEDLSKKASLSSSSLSAQTSADSFQQSNAIRATVLNIPVTAVNLQETELKNLSAQNNTMYIVVFDDAMALADLDDHISSVLGDVAPKYMYQHALKGFAAELSPDALMAAQKHPMFKYYEEDQMMYASDELQGHCQSKSAPSWGLCRVSERQLRIDNTYMEPNKAGVDVDVYVIDTGIYIEHDDFDNNRAKFGFKAESSWSNTDGNGHGTHVASTIGGVTYGLAKKVELIAVKVLSDSGSGSNAGVIAGVDFVTGRARGSNKPVVGNMSLGGGLSTALNNACNNAVDAGVFLAVAAGNDNANACSYSPASAAKVTTVGATDRTDLRSSFSNWGTCVDVFGPGTSITAAWIGSRTAIRTISGTSMASPHIAGIGALVWSQDNKANAAEVRETILRDATSGAINMGCTGTCGATVNKLGFNGCNH
jgi:subtilisin family serine protease